MTDRPLRLGDVIDDYCPRCRLLLNHDIASLFDGGRGQGHLPDLPQHPRLPPRAGPAKRKTQEGREEEPDRPGPGRACRRRPPAAAARRPRPVRRRSATSGPSVERLKKKIAAVRAVDVIQRKRDGQELTPRGDRLLHPRLHRGRDPRLPGLRPGHGRLLPGHDAGRDGRPHRGDDAHGRGARPLRPARAQGRQALDGRRGRQDQPGPRPAGRGLRRLRADDLGPRPRPHRRHPRQARVDPRLPRRLSLDEFRDVLQQGASSASSARRPRSPPPTASSTRCATSPPRSRACPSSPPRS